MFFLERRLFFVTAGREKQFIYSKKEIQNEMIVSSLIWIRIGLFCL